LLSDQLPKDADCLKAPGPLITPDLVVLRPDVCKRVTRVSLKDMRTKKSYSQAARVQGILRTSGARQGISTGEFAEEFGATKRILHHDLKALGETATSKEGLSPEGGERDTLFSRQLIGMP
jgi:hypothetical protein